MKSLRRCAPLAVLLACTGDISQPSVERSVVVPVTFEVTGPDTINALFDTVQYAIIARDEAGEVIGNPQVGWSELGAALERVGGGRFRSVRRGNRYVRAQLDYNGSVYRDSIRVNVRQIPALMTLSAARTTIEVDDTITVLVAAEDSNGYAMPNPVVSWSTSNRAVLTTTKYGRVFGNDIGSANITATLPPVPPVSINFTVDLPTPHGIIAFSGTDGTPGAHGDIYTMHADGSNVTRLTTTTSNDSWPAWSPDGSKIVFAAWTDHGSNLYVMSAEGAGLTALTTGPRFDHTPAWSRDGTRIAFRAGGGWEPDHGLWMVNADGSNMQLLKRSAEAPSWTPSGRIVFRFFPDSITSDIGELDPAAPAVAIVRSGSPGNQLWPAVSPDGAHVAYFVDRRDALILLNQAGDEKTLRKELRAGVGPVSWSPDGRFLVFRTGILHVRTRRIVRVLTGVRDPAWRPI
jgi:hypothetical protein